MRKNRTLTLNPDEHINLIVSLSQIKEGTVYRLYMNPSIFDEVKAYHVAENWFPKLDLVGRPNPWYDETRIGRIFCIKRLDRKMNVIGDDDSVKLICSRTIKGSKSRFDLELPVLHYGKYWYLLPK